MQRDTHTIDAKNKSPGRLATKVAGLLRGKHKRDFTPHIDNGDFVLIKNVSKMKITGKKLEQKKYYRHSGYPGGLKEKSLKRVFAENPAQVLKIAVYGMLPKNRLRPRQIKRLKFEEENK